jgi:parallel beta helix pectate lyase-like protein
MLRRSTFAALVLTLFLALAAVAAAHVERPSYFPQPEADTSVKPAAGGKVPKVRSLASALRKAPPGRTRVVCRRDSMKRLKTAVRRARKRGYDIRPTDHRKLSRKQAAKLLRTNRKLRQRCRYREIQPAVTASSNNDRVVIMPGLYTEPTARAAKTQDPACADYRTNGDRPGDTGTALSYEYQLRCPNDQNLIAVIGRSVGPGEDPVPPRESRFGIPNLGSCIRCNVQIEGSGVGADDVIVDAGDTKAGNGGPNGAGFKKDVGIRADRADGFVLRNVTVRHAGEHGVYVIETDGYRLDRFKTYYSKLYGTLTFASDHGVQSNCDAAGHGDSGIYPGGAPDTGVQRQPGTRARLNQLVTRCDLHHNMAGYSGTNGNAVHIKDNAIYDNALGIQTDVVTAAGHPGFPGDSMLVNDNRIYSNNFNLYADESDVEPAFPFPVGTGMWIAGGNHHTVRDNYFYDNWRRGTMQFSVPDALICGPAADGNEQAGCDSTMISTSHYNRWFDNHMGVTPAGEAKPNGVDFWWDNFAGARGNCWFRNSDPGGVTTDPASLPDCANGTDPALSLGIGDPENESELVRCVAAFETRDFSPGSPCPWLQSPPPPDGSARTAAFTPLFGSRAAPPQPPSTQDPVPLSQAACADWLAADAAGRAELVRRVSAFAGGVVNSGTRDLGTGATLPPLDATALYDNACTKPYARGFLLYKLYTYSAAWSQ